MPSTTRTLASCAVAALSILGVTAALSPTADASSPDVVSKARSYDIALFGDMPYGDLGRAQFPAVLSDINASKIAFSLFDGDIKSGSEPCYADVDGSAAAAGKEDIYKRELALFNTLERPVVFTPGDNEWTDCDRPATKGPTFDATDRLAYERTVFFPTDRTLGEHTFTVHRQSAQFPENARFVYGPVMYVTVNIPGSDNNWATTPADGNVEESHIEYTARDAANLAWLTESFAAAKSAGVRGLMIVTQADMFPDTNVGAPLDHYADTKALLARQTVALGQPVVLVNGDSHFYVNDKPLTDDAGNTIENFQRVMTFGSGQNHWVSAHIDAHTPQVFTFQQHIIAANVPAYVFN